MKNHYHPWIFTTGSGPTAYIKTATSEESEKIAQAHIDACFQGAFKAVGASVKCCEIDCPAIMVSVEL